MAYSSRTMKRSDWILIRHFTRGEFVHPEKMGYEFMFLLDRLRSESGVAIRITSGHRPPEHNERVGGATDSAHMDVPCDAIDIGLVGHPQGENYARFQIIKAALDLGFTRIGTYADGSLHLDKTEHRRPAPRIWRVVR